MLGVKHHEPKLYYQLSLDQLVAQNDFYRLVNGILDLSFLYDLCQPVYGDTGRPSIDPTVFFKIELVGYLENIISDRALSRRIHDSLSIRYFIEHDLDEATPWHSTLSRTRSVIPAPIYQEAFNYMLRLCIQAGLVDGQVESVDSSLIKANASLDSLEKKTPQLNVLEYRQKALDNNPTDSAQQSSTQSVQRLPPPPTSTCDSSQTHVVVPQTNLQIQTSDQQTDKTFTQTNKEYFSPSDPDARIARKPGTPTNLYYKEQVCVDSACNIVTAAEAVWADCPDQNSLMFLVDQAQQQLARHQIKIQNVVTDGGYFSTRNLLELERRNIEAFILNPSLSSGPNAQYHPAIQRLILRLNSAVKPLMKRIRQTSAETILGEHKNICGLRQILCRGIDRARKKVLMASFASNLKKLIKYGRPRSESGVHSNFCSDFELQAWRLSFYSLVLV